MVGFVTRIAQLQIAKAREHRAIACVARGHDAVKHVNTLRHAFDQIFGSTHAHEVAWLVGGQTVRCVRHDLQHLFFGLAHAHTANGITWKIHTHQLV